MLKQIFSSLAFIVLTLIGSVLALPSGLIDRTGDLVLRLARWWARSVLASGGVRIRVRSHAQLDARRPYVFMANHLSMVDIWAVLIAVPVPLRFIAKKQLAAHPCRTARCACVDGRPWPAVADRAAPAGRAVPRSCPS